MKKNKIAIYIVFILMVSGLSVSNLYAQLLPIKQFDHPDWNPNEHIQIMMERQKINFLRCGLPACTIYSAGKMPAPQ